MLQKLFTLILVALCTSTINAKSLVVVLSDSTKIYFLLDDQPVMKLTGETVTIGTRNFQFKEISKFYISNTDDPTGIENLMAKKSVKFDGNQVVVDGKQKIELFTTNGLKQDIDVSTSADMTIVDISKLPHGTYILRTGKTSVKFTKK